MSHPAPTSASIPLVPTSGVPPTGSRHRAVEVVATFGDAIVGVRHVVDPRGGVVRATTRALIAGGAALLVTTALGFGWAAGVAADNADARAAWKRAGKPDWAFRPQRMPVSSGGLDALTLGGSILGLGALTWGLSRRRQELLPARVRLGTGPGVDFALEGVGDGFDLVAPAGDGFAVHVPGAATGSDAAAGARIPVVETTRLRFRVGKTAFHVASVPAPTRTAAAGLVLERRPLAFFAASALVHLGVVALLRTVPADQSNAIGDDGIVEEALLTASAESSEEIIAASDRNDDASQLGGAHGFQSMAGVSGTAGVDTKPSSDVVERSVRREGPTSVARQKALEEARIYGILGSVYLERGDLFASIAGQSDLTSGFDDLDVIGGWDGTGTGAPHGFGNGPSGFGPGGGGNDQNSVWSGAYHTIGTGLGTGSGYGVCDGCRGGMRGRVAKAPIVVTSEPHTTCTTADCDVSIIKRYIKRNLAKITYCYERQLLATPGLSGTVDTLFTVMPNGHVVESKASGVDPRVSSCVADVIANIQFPRFAAPFQVKYPFIMHRAGQ